MNLPTANHVYPPNPPSLGRWAGHRLNLYHGLKYQWIPVYIDWYAHHIGPNRYNILVITLRMERYFRTDQKHRHWYFKRLSPSVQFFFFFVFYNIFNFLSIIFWNFYGKKKFTPHIDVGLDRDFQPCLFPLPPLARLSSEPSQ